jgi:short-subunit dehydrogenase involved in D-alanine esterification of teichoic acids
VDQLQVIERLLTERSQLDILANNAGIIRYVSPENLRVAHRRKLDRVL